MFWVWNTPYFFFSRLFWSLASWISFARFGPDCDNLVFISEEDKEANEAADATQKLKLETNSNGNSAEETAKPVSSDDANNWGG